MPIALRWGGFREDGCRGSSLTCGAQAGLTGFKLFARGMRSNRQRTLGLGRMGSPATRSSWVWNSRRSVSPNSRISADCAAAKDGVAVIPSIPSNRERQR